MPPNRVSNHISHVGILVRSEGSATKFYRDILGFRELSRGSAGGQPGWVDMQVPDGSDYIELLPFADVPSSSDLRARNHLGLATPNVRKTVASLQLRAKTGLLHSSVKFLAGGDLPPRADLVDPDGARIEMMEPISKGQAVTAVSHP